jgi:hypothetical protein
MGFNFFVIFLFYFTDFFTTSARQRAQEFGGGHDVEVNMGPGGARQHFRVR